MSLVCAHGYIIGRCPVEDAAPFRPNVDRHGLPRDYATYEWLMYGQIVEDKSPERIAFLHGPRSGDEWEHPNLGVSVMYR